MNDAAFRRAAGLTADNGKADEDICRQLWPTDRTALRLITRAPPTIDGTSSVWAATSAAQVSLDFLRQLPSAAAVLISRGLSFPLSAGAREALLPRQASGPVVAPWVEEGAPIPTISTGLDHVLMPVPKKLGMITLATRELAKKPFAEAAIRQALAESAVRSLDAAYFSSAAASAAGHAGLLSFATDLGVGVDLAEDIGLAAASVASGLAPVLFVVSPGNREKAIIRLPDIAPSNIVASSVVSDSTLIAIDPSAFAHGVGAPDILASKKGTAARRTAI